MQSGTHVGDLGSRSRPPEAMDCSDMKPRQGKRVNQKYRCNHCVHKVWESSQKDPWKDRSLGRWYGDRGVANERV